MIFSSNNSFDNSIKYINKNNELPFTGNYESVSNKETIYIYCKTSKNDVLQIQFTNDKNDTEYTTYIQYELNSEEKKIIITPQLKYFRIYITSSETFSQSDLRIYNTYLSDTQILLTDDDGNLLTTSSGGVSSNVAVVNTPTISFQDTQTDAFGRFRTSQPFTLFDSSNVNYMNTKFSEYTNTTN